jgi:hypothetical protein
MADTVGSLVDKISIMELKLYHMQLQVNRADATPQHRDACAQKAAVIRQQKDDLSVELSELLDGVISGSRTMKVYRQFKMYNDPIYRSQA